MSPRHRRQRSEATGCKPCPSTSVVIPDDAHLFVTEEQIGAEYEHIFALADRAFYGPKVDILMEDALGREWQMGTIQLDFQLPRRFGCVYVDRDGSEKTPVVIHRVIYGSMERFIGILLEHTAGALSVWLAPVQARIIPITDHHLVYGQQVAAQLRKAGLRVEVDDTAKRMTAKIRDAQVQKVPYMLVIGNRDLENGQVAVRLRTEEDLGALGVDAFIALAQQAVSEKRPI